MALLSALSVTTPAQSAAEPAPKTAAEYRLFLEDRTFFPPGSRPLYLGAYGNAYEPIANYRKLMFGPGRYRIDHFRWSVSGTGVVKVCRSPRETSRARICYRASEFLRVRSVSGDRFNMRSMKISPALEKGFLNE